jgi:hypothetical protein
MNKIHIWIQEPSASRLTQGKTVCGIVAWESEITPSEAETAVGNRIEICTTGTMGLRIHEATCDTCKKNYKV